MVKRVVPFLTYGACPRPWNARLRESGRRARLASGFDALDKDISTGGAANYGLSLVSVL
jgi:hypothetical protein